MKQRTCSSETRRRKYSTYLKQHYASLKEQRNRGAYVPDMEHFLSELQTLVEEYRAGQGPIAANG